MRRAKIIFLRFVFWTPIFFGIILSSAHTASAEKLITLSAHSAYINHNDYLEIQVKINTDAEKVNAIGFSIDFSNEILEGLPPSRTGSAFPMWVTETATRIDCGVYGQNGFSGEGLITTLRFRGRKVGVATINITNVKVLFAGNLLSGYETAPIDINVLTSGAEDIVVDDPNVERITLYPPTLQQTPNPNVSGPVTQSTTSQAPSSSFGSIAQVTGLTGSTPEEPLQKADSIINSASVKGMFGANSILWSSVLPTSLLLAIIIILGIKLFLNEKKRHLAIERIMNKQLGALAVLENKIDIVEQKGADGKAQYLQDIKQVKDELMSDNLESKPHDQKIKP